MLLTGATATDESESDQAAADQQHGGRLGNAQRNGSGRDQNRALPLIQGQGLDLGVLIRENALSGGPVNRVVSERRNHRGAVGGRAGVVESDVLHSRIVEEKLSAGSDASEVDRTAPTRWRGRSVDAAGD